MIFTPKLKKAIRFATKTHEVYQSLPQTATQSPMS